MRATVTEVTTLRDAFRMRRIRNEVRHFMTHDQSWISPVRQTSWYFGVYVPKRRAGLMCGYLVWLEGRPVGYGLVSWRDGRYWVSGGLTAVTRGNGLGRKLFTVLTNKALEWGWTSWLDVRSDNLAARRLYDKLGYKLVRRNGQNLVMSRGL